jgi:broad specificity phosphatase PhoE
VVLESVEWGEPVASLLSRFKEIDEGPAVLILRHSEVTYQTIEDLYTTKVTDLGLKAAYEVGSMLPPHRTYRVYHTCYPRTEQTAEEIVGGLGSVGARVSLEGELPNMNLPMEDDLAEAVWNYPEGSWFFADWFSHRLDPDFFPSPLDLARMTAKQVSFRLKDADPDGIDIHVSHGEMVALYQFFWLGIPPVKGRYGYLNGFILQLGEDGMTACTEDGISRLNYPHWWEF